MWLFKITFEVAIAVGVDIHDNLFLEPTTEREEIDLMDWVEDIKYHLNRIDQLTLIVDENREVPEVNMAKLLQQEFKNSTLIENLVSENARLLRGFVEGFSKHYI